HADRARVHDGTPEAGVPLGGLEHVDGADDVDERAERRVGPRERNLQRREVDQVGDPVLVEGAPDRVAVGDVAADEGDLRELALRHDEPEPLRIARHIEGHDGRASGHERAYGPRADAPEGAGDEEPLPRRAVRGAVRRSVGRAVPVGPAREAGPDHDACSVRNRLTSRPMRSISTTTSSPSASQTGGFRNAPTPLGVPVAMTSPGSSVNACEQWLTISATP